jgi:hypothetical protein
MKINTTQRTRVDDKRIPYGVYVFQCEDGEYLGDGDGNLMLVFGLAADAKIHARTILTAARHYGFTKGKVQFWRGQRPVTDEEFETQMARHKLGLVPDPYDMSAFLDEMGAKKQNG